LCFFEQSTHKYVSELLGKETIDTNTYGKSHGRNGSYSTNYQQSGRELLTPDEIARLDNSYSILFIRGERAVMDFKYDILKHPEVGLTTDGKGKPYTHGTYDKNVGTVYIQVLGETDEENELIDTSCELITETELEESYIKKGKSNEKRKRIKKYQEMFNT